MSVWQINGSYNKSAPNGHEQKMMPENEQHSAFRIIDASYNRAMEGLRVVEEFARMHLNDRLLSKTMKQLRHDLADAITKSSAKSSLDCRDILNDVGTTVQTEAEYQREGVAQIVRSNFARVLQSLRSIEEYSKMAVPEISQEIEGLRYRTYAAEKVVVNTADSCANLNSASVYVLTDTRGSLKDFEKLVTELVAAGTDLIQLRDKRLDDRQLVDAGKLLTKWTRDSETRWIMNDRADLAELSGADGVHVGQNDIEVTAARSIVGVGKIIGVSTHNFEQAQQAVFNGANYIGVGPVFPSQTKSFEQFASREFIERVANELSLPAFAIGGVNLENVMQLKEMNISRVAVSGAVIQAESPRDAAREFKLRLQPDSMTQSRLE